MEKVAYCRSRESRRSDIYTQYGSCRAKSHRAAGWEPCGLSRTIKFTAQEYPSVFSLIDKYSEENDPRRLGELVDRLIQSQASAELDRWLERKLDVWLREKHTALAAVIEAAVTMSLVADSRGPRRELSAVQKAIVKVLAFPDANDTVASVAAQRVRLLAFPDTAVRKHVWLNLKRWLEVWIRNPGDEELAELALPSAAVVGQEAAANWLVEVIQQERAPMCRAAVIGIVNWAAETDYAIDEQTAQALSRAVVRRLEQEANSDSVVSSELLADLVWALGAIATKSDLAPAAKLIARCFQEPRWVEDAAATSAARILFKRFKSEAQRILGEALGGRDSDTYMKFELAILPPTVNLNHHGANGFDSARVWDNSTR